MDEADRWEKERAAMYRRSNSANHNKQADAELARLRRRSENERAKGRMTASDFARLHGLNAYVLRRKMRKLGMGRAGRGGGNKMSVEVLERVWGEIKG
jgi:hypothetical protein